MSRQIARGKAKHTPCRSRTVPANIHGCGRVVEDGSPRGTGASPVFRGPISAGRGAPEVHCEGQAFGTEVRRAVTDRTSERDVELARPDPMPAETADRPAAQDIALHPFGGEGGNDERVPPLHSWTVHGSPLIARAYAITASSDGAGEEACCWSPEVRSDRDVHPRARAGTTRRAAAPCARARTRRRADSR